VEIHCLHIPSDSATHSGDIVFFVTFGDYIYIKPTFLSITPFSIKFPVNIRPGSWSFLFSLLIAKYEISPKVTKNQFQPDFTLKLNLFTKSDEKPAN
jgi:hypothetical protein